MPVADHATYCAMLDKALDEHYAYPAINVLQIDTLNAAIEGFAAAKSDGIVQISVAAGTHTSGALNDPVLGAITLAEHAHRLAEKYDVTIAVHSDHCPTEKVDSFLKPLIAETARRRVAGQPALFQSHMYDGSGLPLTDNLKYARELLRLCADNGIVLEVEAGVVGGEEDGMRGDHSAKLYSTPEDMIAVYETLSRESGARFMLAATFGNVHGVYKPGQVQLKPAILKAGQDAVVAKFGEKARLWLVFHGGSGSSTEEIHETLEYGVVKMNIHTDTQYAFTRGVVDHVMKNYDGVLMIDGEVGRKNDYLASTWLNRGKAMMVKRVVEACEVLRSAGKSLTAC
ncbi:MAG: class II fructose-bisphosphate aldolase [Candidatus Hydrogenedentes bacterium]|nr:class II fructose-bisphosphate aldolase [Candidatus Hydrogenedentota bacterium]